MLALEQYREILNPHGAHALWGDSDLPNRERHINNAFGSAVVADKGSIPLVRYGAYVAGETQIIGNVRIDEHATIRRKSFVYGSKDHGTIMEAYSLIMDYCTIIDSKLGFAAGFAHGGVSYFANWGDWSFANIAPFLNGRADKQITVEKGAYIGPGVKVPAGAVVRTNLYYLANLILPNVGLDPKTFEPVGVTKRGDLKEHGALYERPLAFSEVQLKEWLGELPHIDKLRANPELLETLVAKIPTREALRPHRLGGRYFNMPHFGDVDVTDLGKNGLDAWLRKRGGEQIHRPTLGNWLAEYLLMQRVKQFHYMNEDAKVQGQLVWHNAAMQSEILHLDRARRIIVTVGGATSELENLIKAKLYLLGAYEINSNDERVALDAAYQKSSEIIIATNTFLKRATPDDIVVSVAAQETLDTVLKAPTGNAHNLVITKEQRNELIKYLRYATQAAEKFKPDATAQSTALPRVASAHQTLPWIEVAKSKVDVRVVGTHIRDFNGNVPVISKDAILAGRNDIGGAGEIGAGVVLHDTSVRSESNTTPFYIAGMVALYKSVVHTAGKEQHPVFITSKIRDAIGALKDGAVAIVKSHIHGPIIDGHTYIEKAILGDEGRQNGIVAAGALNPGSDLGASAQGGVPALVAGNLATNLSSTRKDGSQYKAFYENFITWWNKSKFAGITKLSPHVANDNSISEFAARHKTTIENTITDIFTRQRIKAEQQLKHDVHKYGQIMRVAPHMQAGYLNLLNAARILEAQSERGAAKNVHDYAQALEYLLGIRKQLPKDALRALEKGTDGLHTALEILATIQGRGDAVRVANWGKKTSSLTVTYDDVVAVAHAGAKPETAVDIINAAIANHPDNNPAPTPERPVPIDHRITSEGVIDFGLEKQEHRIFHPKQIALMIAEIAKIPEIVDDLKHKIEPHVTLITDYQLSPRLARLRKLTA